LAVIVANMLSKVDVTMHPVSLTIIELCAKDRDSIRAFDIELNVLSAAKKTYMTLVCTLLSRPSS
jgi:hypothetical protein